MGEALSYAFGAVPITADCILRTNFLSLADEFAILRGGEQAPVAAASSVGSVAAAVPGDAMEVVPGDAEEIVTAAAVHEDLVGTEGEDWVSNRCPGVDHAYHSSLLPCCLWFCFPVVSSVFAYCEYQAIHVFWQLESHSLTQSSSASAHILPPHHACTHPPTQAKTQN